MLAVIDIDSTLYPANALFSKVAGEVFGKVWPDHDYWATSTDAGWEPEELKALFERCHERDMIMSTKPYPGAVVALHELQAEGFEILYASNRNPDSWAATSDWLFEHGFPSPTDLWASYGDKVTEVIHHLRPEIVIDDRVKTMIAARDRGAVVLSVRQKHNVNLTGEIPGVFICKDWFVIQTVLKTQVLPALREESLV